MNYTINKEKEGIIEIKISFEQDEWTKAQDEAYNKNKSKYSVQGFRKGKAPKAVIEKQYGETVFSQLALDEILYVNYNTIIQNEKFEPIDSPNVSLDRIDETGVDMTITVPVAIDFELGAYKGLDFVKTIEKATDAQIQERIDRDLLRGSKLVDSTEKIKNDDVVTLDFAGYIDNEQFEGGTSNDYQLKIGSHTFIDNFEEQLIGLAVGDEKDVLVTFPEQYHEAKYAGKPAVFKVKINKVRVREMSEFNLEFVKNVSEFDTIEEYKNNIKSIIESDNEIKSNRELENTIIDKIVENTTMTINDILIEKESRRMIDGLANQLSRQGMSIDDYLAYIGKTMEDLKAEQKTFAEKNVKSRLILEKIIEVENITVEKDEFDKNVEEYAKSQGITAKEMQEKLSEQEVTRMVNTMVTNKIFEFLMTNNNIIVK